MEVKNQVFYHIHRNDKLPECWRVNSTIYWGKEGKNNFNKFYDEHGFSTNLTNGNGSMYGVEALENFLMQPEFFQKQNYKNMLRRALTIVKEQGIFIRETIFEEVRMKYFPELPSRKTCIWVCEKESVPYWCDELSGERKIFKVEVSGNIHKADQGYLVSETISHNALRELAYKYWSGTHGQSSIGLEILFEGEIKILDEYRNLEEFNKRYYEDN